MYESSSAFGGCVSVRGVAPICDALVGARKYTDFGVLADVSCLLGEDRKAAECKVEDSEGGFPWLVHPGCKNGTTGIWSQ